MSKPKVNLKKSPLFYTPKSMQELEDWLGNLSGDQAAVGVTAAMLAWNLACELTNPGGGPELTFTLEATDDHDVIAQE